MDSLKMVSLHNLSCPVCDEIFSNPVILSCGHNVCKTCLQNFWKKMELRECPVCKVSSKDDPSCNQKLKVFCETFKKGVSSSEVLCSVHMEKLKIFCKEDEQPICLVCRDSKNHTNHTFSPINEAVETYKGKLSVALKSLQDKLKHRETVKEEYNVIVQQIKTQAQHTEGQIKQEFEKLYQFLRKEETDIVKALKEEEEKKSRMMQENLEMINKQISALSDTIKDIEERMKASDILFLNNFNATMERAQSTHPDPEMAPGALINVADYLSNLPFKVWKKMQEIVQNTPLTLDPNTAAPWLKLSSDLTNVTYTDESQKLPNNPERFDKYPCVLTSEGFDSGTHSWDVEVGDNTCWILGITTASNRRKGELFFNANVWRVQYIQGKYISRSPEQLSTRFAVEGKLQRVRVLLDWDGGKVSFSDPVTNKPLRSFTTTFTEKVFPFLYSHCTTSLKILPV